MKINAINIKKEIEVECYETEDGLRIVPHSALEKLADEYNIRYHQDLLFCNGYQIIFKCTATANLEGIERYAEQIGESSKSNLTTKISQSYPAIMASKRAFDRAVIRLLGFEGVYSDNEIETPKEKAKSKETSANNNVEKETQQKNASAPTDRIENESANTVVANDGAIPEMQANNSAIANNQKLVLSDDDFANFGAEEIESPDDTIGNISELGEIDSGMPIEEDMSVLENTEYEKISTQDDNKTLNEKLEKSCEDNAVEGADKEETLPEKILTENVSANPPEIEEKGIETESVEKKLFEEPLEADVKESPEKTSEVAEDIKEEAAEKLMEEDIDESNGFLNTLVCIGRYKKKYTMMELYSVSKENLEWIADNPSAAEPFASQSEAAKKTIEYMKNKGV